MHTLPSSADKKYSKDLLKACLGPVINTGHIFSELIKIQD